MRRTAADIRGLRVVTSRRIASVLSTRGGRWRAGRSRSAFREMGPVRGIVAVVALLLGAYCLVVAAVLYASAQPAAGDQGPPGRYDWPAWIPVAFLALLVLYGVAHAVQRRGAQRPPLGPTHAPSPSSPPEPGRRGDTPSR